MRIDRMLGITVLLLNRDRVSARQLSEKFEVSVRTIYRDIEAINMAGIPIVAYSGSNGGFGILENYRLDRQVLTLQDMISIITALKGVSRSLGDSGLETVTEKILNLIPPDKIDYLKQQSEEVAIDMAPWGHKIKSEEFFQIIRPAIAERSLIEFVYSNARGEMIRRTVEPMTLIFKGYAWYLFAFCRMRNDYRLFRLSRMENLINTKESFERRSISYHEFFKNSATETKTINLVLRFEGKMRIKVEEYFDENGVEIQDDGSIIVKISMPEDEWMYSTILGFGEYVEVLEPEYLRCMILEKAKKISSKYKHDIKVSQP